MTAHNHPDESVLHVGCPACSATARVLERMQLLDEAPLRRCTWHVTYWTPATKRVGLTFNMVVRVPTGWTGDQVDNEYAGLTGEVFALALPATVPMDATDIACSTMEVVRVDIGGIVPEVHQPAHVIDQPSLFELGAGL